VLANLNVRNNIDKSVSIEEVNTLFAKLNKELSEHCNLLIKDLKTNFQDLLPESFKEVNA